jgi:hypothetical protein
MVVFGGSFSPTTVIQWNGISKATTFWSTIRLSTVLDPTDLKSAGTAQVRLFDPATNLTSDSKTFTITPLSAPVISSFSPTVGVIGQPGMTLSVRGSNFLPGMVVKLSGSPRPTTYVSASVLNASLSASDLSTGQIFAVTVDNPSAHQLSNSVYFATAFTDPPGPTLPIPTTLWQPPVGATPVSGSYLYLESDSGDYIGGGKRQLISGLSSVVVFPKPVFVGLDFHIGDWYVDFSTMGGVSQFQRGYYANAQRDAFKNPAVGGLDVSGEGRGCNSLIGWFVLDEVTYSGATLRSFTGRFEQHCEAGSPALRGAFRWVAPN